MAVRADQAVEQPILQRTLLEQPLADDVDSEGRKISGTSGNVELIRLDNTGIVSWRFLNPRRPVLVARPNGVEFKNDTADRTFSILVPITIKTSDPEYKYPTLMRHARVLLDRQNRIDALNEEIQRDTGAASATLRPFNRDHVEGSLNSIDRLLRVREVIAGADVAVALTKLGDGAFVDPVALAGVLRKPYSDRRQELLNREKELLRYARLNFPEAMPPPATEHQISDVRARVDQIEAEIAAATSPAATTTPDPLITVYAELAMKQPSAFMTEITRVEDEIAIKEKALASPPPAGDAQLRNELARLYARAARLRRAQAEVEPVPAPKETDKHPKERRALNNDIQLVRGELAMLDADRDRLEAEITKVRDRLRDKTDSDLVGTTGPARDALDSVARDLADQIKAERDKRVKAVDDAVKALREQWRRRSRSLRVTVTERRKLEARVRRANELLELLEFHGKTDVNSSLGARFGGAGLRNCSDDGTTYACSVVRIVEPGGVTAFTSGFLDTIGSGLIKFSVRFFDEVDEPANADAYITRVEKPTTPKSEFTWGLTGGVGFDRDPALQQRPVVPTSTAPAGPPADCPLLVCLDGHRNHFNGAGRLDLKQRILNFIDAQGSLSFKKGDLGQGEDKDKLAFSKYQFNIFGESGITIQFGKFDFAAPSNGIAISESGEGFRVRGSLGSLYDLVRRHPETSRPGEAKTFMQRLGSVYAGVSYLLRRESESGAADRANLDSNSYLIELNNVMLWKSGLRSMNLFHVRGSNETRVLPVGEVDPAKFTRVPYDFNTTGVELRYAIPLMKVNGTAGFYSSRRNAESDAVECSMRTAQSAPCNGQGSVWLATATRSFSIDAKGRALRAIALTIGEGSGDDASTKARDESYVGETGGYKPDLIFLSALATPFNSFERGYSDVPISISPFGLGAGLSNKRYWSSRYTENSKWGAPQYWLIHKVFDVSEDDIAGHSTIVTYHRYQLREPFDGARDLGQELDVEFQIESPKGVKSSLKSGYFRPEGAAERFVRRGIWTISMSVSLSI